jgi:anthranilate synthase component 1
VPLEAAPDPETFRRLAREATVVPVHATLLADALTPVSAWAALGGGPGSFLLESVEHGEKWGRYSFLGVDAERLVRGRPGRFEVWSRDELLEARKTTDPWRDLRALMASYRPPKALPEGLPRFWGGAVGYVAYEAVRAFEPTVGPRPESGWDFSFAVGGTLLAFDDVEQTVTLLRAVRVEEGDSDDDLEVRRTRAVAALERTAERLGRSSGTGLMALPRRSREVEVPPSSFTREAFEEAVRQAQEAILEGEIFQLVLSQKFRTPAEGVDLFELYRALRVINPSPYMYLVRLPELGIAGASPETLVRVTGRRAEVRPIAGTRPRGRDDAEDRALAEELLEDPKERAEHVMLVDLGRNDLGRIAAPGSVALTDRMIIERYSHVMHIVSNVAAELAEGKDALDVLRATFPAGTLSGAPKIRAMQLIDELEPVPRGLYGGAVGYLGFDGNLDMAIAIRTIVEEGGELTVQAGAGIVEASDPAKEYDETVDKARAALGAIEAVRRKRQ